MEREREEKKMEREIEERAITVLCGRERNQVGS